MRGFVEGLTALEAIDELIKTVSTESRGEGIGDIWVKSPNEDFISKWTVRFVSNSAKQTCSTMLRVRQPKKYLRVLPRSGYWYCALYGIID